MVRLIVAGLVFSIAGLFATGRAAAAGEDTSAHRGCCSHHGGVCGCKSERAVCCDGGFSPSCGCD